MTTVRWIREASSLCVERRAAIDSPHVAALYRLPASAGSFFLLMSSLR